MKFILGQKQHMVQYFDDNGTVTPVTLVSAGPLIVTQVKTPEADGYHAIQVAYLSQKKERATKAHLGHVKPARNASSTADAGGEGAYKHLREFSEEDGPVSDLKLGDKITVAVFKEGDNVFVSGVSKGKGFQGVVKRHNFEGGPRTHGQKHSEREPGSIGGGLRNRVPKGTRMGGRMGGDRITVKNLKIVGVDTANNQLLIKGAIPGRRGSLIEIIG
jgi:large subunit ribosomal protein L3